MAEAYIKMFLDFPEKVSALNTEQKWELVETMIEYCKTRQMPDPAKHDPFVNVIFPAFKTQIDRDHAEYMRIAERNQQNGQKGGRPPKDSKKTQQNPENPVGFEEPSGPQWPPVGHKNKESGMRNEESGMRNEESGMRNQETTTPNPLQGESGGGGGDLPQEFLDYAREQSRGAKSPAAYEAAILRRIREGRREGKYKTIEEVRAADEDRRKRQVTPPGPVYADEDDYY